MESAPTATSTNGTPSPREYASSRTVPSPTLPVVEEQATPTGQGLDLAPHPSPAVAVPAQLEAPAPEEPPMGTAVDAPMCMQCGVQMIRAGSCHACPSCGNTSGCS